MITYRHGEDAARGGLDITISLTPEETRALSSESDSLVDWLDTALWALVALRTGKTFRDTGRKLTDAGEIVQKGPREISVHDWHDVISDLDQRLLPRLEGIRDAAMRRHREQGASVGDLARAMDTPRSTAQSRREALERRQVSTWESWATSGGPLYPGAVSVPVESDDD